MSPTIYTIGFDGPHRVGKGVLAARLGAWLDAQGIPWLLVRGDGSREGLGRAPGDPPSPWWQAVNRWLRDEATPLEAWNRTSYRLARELLVWRDRALPCRVRAAGKPVGVLLVDRTLLSRTMIPRRMGTPDVARNLYPPSVRERGRRITAEAVCPDLIVRLTAPTEALLARLQADDPKYAFRHRLITATSAWYEDAAEYLPAALAARIVTLDTTESEAATFAALLAVVGARFPALASPAA